MAVRPDDTSAVNAMVERVEKAIDAFIRDYIVRNGPVVTTVTVLTMLSFGPLVKERIYQKYADAGWSDVYFRDGECGVSVTLRA